jgi:Ca2+-binding RTX toxin-like protein
VSGDKGDDIVVGGQGDDVVVGGEGADTLSGNPGSDTLTGGAGADVFHSFAATGTDLITDFNAAEGDRLMLDPGTTYTLSQHGADTIVAMTGGGEVILANVQLSSLSAGWIVA